MYVLSFSLLFCQNDKKKQENLIKKLMASSPWESYTL